MSTILLSKLISILNTPFMNLNSTERNGASLDVITEALKIHTSNTGRIKDRIARKLVSLFLKSLEDFETTDGSFDALDDSLRQLVIEALHAYANGGSFDLVMGGRTQPNPSGRQNRARRDRLLRKDLMKRLVETSDVFAATFECASSLAAGNVEGLTAQRLSPSSIRRIWYASPVVNECGLGLDNCICLANNKSKSHDKI